MQLYDTDSSNVEFISKIVSDVFGDYIPFKIVSADKMTEIIKCKRTSVEAEYLAKKDPAILVMVFEDAFDLLDDETKEFVVRKGIQGVSYNQEKCKINICNDLVKNICGLRTSYKYESKPKDFMDMVEAEKAGIEQILEQRKAEQKAKKEKPQA